jgi:hypothetical protein
MALVAQYRSVGSEKSAIDLPVKDDNSQPEYAYNNPAGVHMISDNSQVSIDEPLDPDVDQGMFYGVGSSPNKNTGAFLDIDGESYDMNSSNVLPVQNSGIFLEIDGEPSGESSADIPAPQNVGSFLDADDDSSDSYFDASNEPIVVNVGKYLDPDGLE